MFGQTTDDDVIGSLLLFALMLAMSLLCVFSYSLDQMFCNYILQYIVIC